MKKRENLTHPVEVEGGGGEGEGWMDGYHMQDREVPRNGQAVYQILY